jgi:hypothetical protein
MKVIRQNRPNAAEQKAQYHGLYYSRASHRYPPRSDYTPLLCLA